MPSDQTPPTDWRTELKKWLAHNPKQMPDELRQIRQQFLKRFPRERIRQMTLEEYALGHEKSKDSFCYWLEWGTDKLGSVSGGSVDKWGVWWDKKKQAWRTTSSFDTPEAAIQHIRSRLADLLDAAEQDRFDELDAIGDQLGRHRNSLRAKPLYLYFPDKFLPVSSPNHQAEFLRFFGLTPEKGLHAANRQLLLHLRSLPEFEGFDTLQVMRFLYHLR